MRIGLTPKITALPLHRWAAGLALVLTTSLIGWSLGAGDNAGPRLTASTETVKPQPAPALPAQSRPDLQAASWAAAASPAAAPEPPVRSSGLASGLPLESPPPASAPASAAQAVPAIPVDPHLPSNHFWAGNQQVAVQGYEPAGPGRGLALDLSLTPASAAPSTTQTTASSATTDTATSGTGPVSDTNTTARLQRGLTYEEQLFRSKWGWSAYATAQRMAQWDK